MRQLLDLKNVVAVGRGYKVVDGHKTAIEAIIASVSVKHPIERLDLKDIVPPVVDGLPTDVVETGVIRAFERTTRERPALGGDSIGHKDITAGTLGALVFRGNDPVILSNNHVLANSNAGVIGDEILQPGPHDGGTAPTYTIATLLDFVPVQFGGIPLPGGCKIARAAAAVLNFGAWLLRRQTRLVVVQAPGENLVDAAIAAPVNPMDVSREIRDIGLVEALRSAQLGDEIQKSGRTTELTQGTIEQVDVTVNVQYGAGQIATFTDQLMAGAMSAPGDSGSAVLRGQELTGLLFAGSETTTVINRIEHVFDLLGLNL